MSKTVSPPPPTLSVSAEDVQGLLRWALEAKIAALFPEEKLEAMAEARLEARIGIISLEAAAARFGKASPRAMRDFCKKHRIPIHAFSQKDRYLKVAEIEAALDQSKVVPIVSPTGTQIGAVGPDPVPPVPHSTGGPRAA